MVLNGYGWDVGRKLMGINHSKRNKSWNEPTKWKKNSDLTWGDWVKPIWPSNRSLQGSIPTPYIFDDRCRWDDAGNAIKEWYDEGQDKREEYGLKGHEFVNGDESMQSVRWMSKNFIDQMDTAFEKWTPRKRYSIFKA